MHIYIYISTVTAKKPLDFCAAYGQAAMLLEALPRSKFLDSKTRANWGTAFDGDNFEGRIILAS
jgi:hypothetical protein